ncbi:MAG TPA: Sir2 family NAD-dependent protein deacetylase [Acidimicrobiales bacterium]|jgi:NAD-dependent deacetylase|nr:Sir2 family NAD-dependent protein deacetylase [Acidimicrobiales bacterium]
MPIDDPAVEAAQAMVERATRIVVLTGAGISTDSGIPDFRGPSGVWTKNPAAEKLSNLETYLADPEVRARAWQSRLQSPTWAAAPNVGHSAVSQLVAGGKVILVVTQNIDGLHQAAGTDPSVIVEIHGTMHEVECMSCGARGPMSPTLARVEAGEVDPPCLACGGILKSATISFGQNLVPADIRRADLAASQCDLLMAVGSSLAVFPAAGLVPTAHRSGAGIVIVNAEPTGFDDLADVVVRVPIGQALPAIVG